jgi:hypothetical protein
MENVRSIVSINKMERLEKIAIVLAGVICLGSCATLKPFVEPKVGVVIPVSEDKDNPYNPEPVFGIGLGLENKPLVIEASLESFNSSGKYIQTSGLTSRLDANLIFFPNSKVRPYIGGGVNLLSESSIVNIPEWEVYEQTKSFTWGGELDVGMIIADSFNLRFIYARMDKSENVKNMFTLMLGYRLYF